MLFRKYAFAGLLNTPAHEDWSLILRSEEEILRYCKHDNEETFNEWLHGDKQSKNPKQKLIKTVIDTAVHTAPKGTKIQPIIEIGKVLDNKAVSMINFFRRAGDLKVNQTGGFCDVSGFEKMWKCETVEELEKSGLGFPEDNEPVAVDLLFLENGYVVDANFQKKVSEKTLTQPKSTYTINKLKTRDERFVGAMIAKAGSIAFETQLLDVEQTKGFIKLFQTLPTKTIYISTTQWQELMQFDGYKECSDRHTIYFF